MPRQLRVFLCHASQDKPAVRKIYAYLKQHGVQPWLDREDLLPGQDWEVEIPKAIFTSDVILVCLSPNSVNKEGYVQKEIVFALDKALEKPQGTIFIIPVKLEECSVPSRLSRYQWVDYYRPDGRKRLLMGLNVRASGLGDDVSPVILEDTRKVKPATKTVDVEKQDTAEIAAREKEERETLELAEREKTERDQVEREKLERDRLERETAENAEREQLARLKAEQEKADRERVEREAKEKAGKQKVDIPIARPVMEKKRDSAIKLNPRRLGFAGIIFVFLLLALFGGNYLIKNLPSSTTETPQTITVTPSKTNTPAPTKTSTPKPTMGHLFTPTSTSAPSPSPTQNLEIGSTMISEKDGMVMIFVPAGEFTMGSNTGRSDEQPVHRVHLDAFWIDQTEVTNAMYAKCVADGDCDSPSSSSSYTHDSYYGNPTYDDYPVIYVNWSQAAAYCKWAGRELPTEAQWEKAARGTDGRTYPWGEGINCDKANYTISCVGDTSEVGSYSNGASIYGALDMAGNVWEWVNDWYGDTYYASSPSSNPSGPASGQYRVLRGGSWIWIDGSARSAGHLWFNPTVTAFYLGFRCSLSQP